MYNQNRVTPSNNSNSNQQGSHLNQSSVTQKTKTNKNKKYARIVLWGLAIGAIIVLIRIGIKVFVN